MGPFYVTTFGEATNSLGQAWWPDSTGICEFRQARVRPNWLCDFCTYFHARVRVCVFVANSSLNHVNPSRQLAHKDTKACDIATRHIARPCVLHMLAVLPSSGSMARKIILLLAAPAMGRQPCPHPTPTPTSWAMGPFYAMTFGKATNSLGQAWWPDSSGMCETCGNAWARAPQLSVTHLEDFYFFMDCTGHEIIISSAPHPKPHKLETAICNIQARFWTLPRVQGHGPLLRPDFRKGHKLAKSSLVA